jgi:hypothetical protein
VRSLAAAAVVLGLPCSPALAAGEPAGAKPLLPQEFASSLPVLSLPIDSWLTTQGAFERRGMKGAYLFYVNPRRPALFQLMRYRLSYVAPASDHERQREATERVVFNADPERRVPLQAWVRSASEPSGWRALVHGTDEYRAEMGYLIRVLQEQNEDARIQRGESENR